MHKAVGVMAIFYLFSYMLEIYSPGIVYGLTPEEKGEELAYKSEENFDNYGDFDADVVMHISDGKGNEVVRSFKLRVQETPGDGDKTLMHFQDPADVKGMSFLILGHKFKFDDTWVYIPDLRRVKRISSQSKGSDFMGSEFVAEDLSRPEPEKFTYNWIGEKPCGELICDLVERYPIEKSSIYSKQVMWIDQDKTRFQQLDHYSKKGEFVKTLKFAGYKLYEGKFWRWDKHIMVNHATGITTISEFKNWTYGVGLKDSMFTVNGLKNIR